MDDALSTRLGAALLFVLAGCTGGTTASPADLAVEDADCKVTNSCRCRGDTECGGLSPRCDPSTRRCVACLPQADNCAAGQVCTATNGDWTCATVCTITAHCAKLSGGGACCDGTCKDVQIDAANCGACGNACGEVANAVTGCANGS